nr:cytochrome c3 family protein [Desulfurobacterium thermolithotrophum]
MRKTLAVLLSVLILPSASEAKLSKTMRQECLVCHENWLLEAKINSSSLLTTNSIQAADKLMCLSCHDGSLADDRLTFIGFGHFSHPVDKKIPKDFKLPKDFPTKDGKLYCGTCHTPHTKAGSEKKLDYTFMRKQNKNSSLCMDCHRENAAHGMNHPILEDTAGKLTSTEVLEIKDIGGKITQNNEVQCESCHSAHKGKANYALVEPLANSQLCTACHTQELNSKEHVNPRNHKIHVNIPEYMTVSEFIRQRLPQNTVECFTCHKMHKEPNPNLTVLSANELCSSCHTAESPVVHSPHNKNNRGCLMCHTAHKAKTDEYLFAVVPSSTGGYKNYDISSRVCVSCHNGGISKVKVGPASASHRGECTDCHNPHIWDPNNPNKKVSVNAKGTPRNSFLKISSPELCIMCHGKRSVEGTFHDFSGKKIKVKNVLGERVSQAGLCESCHAPHKAVGPYLWGVKLSRSAKIYAKKLGIKDSYSKVCLSCHYLGGIGEDIGKISHPVGKKLQAKTDLPLSKTGIMTCSTCHDPHKWTSIEGSKSKAATSFLRVPEWNLCLKCHSNKSGVLINAHSDIKDVNVLGETPDKAGVCAACHVPHRAVGRFLRGIGDFSSKEKEGEFCLECHGKDGIAKDKVMGSSYPDHPMNIENPSKELPGKLITCFTCHDAHSTLEFMLRKSVANDSALCLTCHKGKDTEGTSHDFLKKKNLPPQERIKIKERGKCSACHTPHNPKFKLLWSRDLGEGETINSRMCGSCHTKGGIAGNKTVGEHTHPIGKKVKSPENIKLVEYSGLPLIDQTTGCPVKNGKSGLMDCVTCHNPHNGADKGRLIRYPIEGDSKLCISCHTQQARVIGTDHDMRVVNKNFKNALGKDVLKDGVCSACHVPHRAKDNLLWAIDVKRITDNKLSNYCLTCHSEDGIAKEKSIKYYFHPSKKEGVVIRDINRPGRKGDWPIYDENGKRVKVGGQITCETCHNPHIWSRWSDRGPGKPVEGNITNSFLRNDQLKGSICVDCHGIEALYRYKFFHSKNVHH